MLGVGHRSLLFMILTCLFRSMRSILDGVWCGRVVCVRGCVWVVTRGTIGECLYIINIFTILQRSQLATSQINKLHLLMVEFLNNVCSFDCRNPLLNPLTIFKCWNDITRSCIQNDWHFSYVLYFNLRRFHWAIQFLVCHIAIIILLKSSIFSNLSIMDQLFPWCAILIQLVCLRHLLELSFSISRPAHSFLN